MKILILDDSDVIEHLDKSKVVKYLVSKDENYVIFKSGIMKDILTHDLVVYIYDEGMLVIKNRHDWSINRIINEVSNNRLF